MVSFRKERQEPALDMKALARQIERDLPTQPASPEAYAPPPKRSTQELGGLTSQAVKKFADLPTSQIDDLITGVEERITAIKKKAEEIKADYLRRTSELQAEVDRLNEACVKSESKMGELYDMLVEIYRPRLPPAPQIDDTQDHRGIDSDSGNGRGTA